MYTNELLFPHDMYLMSNLLIFVSDRSLRPCPFYYKCERMLYSDHRKRRVLKQHKDEPEVIELQKTNGDFTLFCKLKWTEIDLQSKRSGQNVTIVNKNFHGTDLERVFFASCKTAFAKSSSSKHVRIFFFHFNFGNAVLIWILTYNCHTDMQDKNR